MSGSPAPAAAAKRPARSNGGRARRADALRWPVMWVLAATFASTALACVPEVPRERIDAEATAGMLRSLVAAVDPSLPELPGADPPDAAMGADMAWLARRNLLSAEAAPATAEALWAAANEELEAAYGVPLPKPLPSEPASLRAALSHWLLASADTVEPAALVATADDDPQHVAFLGVIWPSPVFPRLIVHRPPEGPVLADGMASLLRPLGTCAVPVEEWIRAPASVALDLFIRENETRMAIVAREPEGEGGFYWIPQGEEVSAFLFEAPGTQELERYAAAFAGPSPGPFALARVLPRVRTSLGPAQIQRLLSSSTR